MGPDKQIIRVIYPTKNGKTVLRTEADWDTDLPARSVSEDGCDHLEFMICKTRSAAVLLVLLVVRPAGAGSVPSDAEAITAAVNGFHEALHRGDSLAVLNSLAPDAVILESGSAQTRAEYAREHLAEDIAFVKAVPGTRSKLSIKQEGNIAWTTATTQSVGTFDGHDVNSVGAELTVLTKMELGWRIRAIHWSSHRAK